jgi:ubiquitin C-terminal hydrolase
MTTRVYRAPRLLIILLKRFKNRRYYSISKNSVFVRYPERLELGPYVAGGQRGLAYELTAVINHVGTLSRGHYTAYSRVETDWYELNDSEVRRVGKERVVSEQAYVLLYRRLEQ